MMDIKIEDYNLFGFRVLEDGAPVILATKHEDDDLDGRLFFHFKDSSFMDLTDGCKIEVPGIAILEKDIERVFSKLTYFLFDIKPDNIKDIYAPMIKELDDKFKAYLKERAQESSLAQEVLQALTKDDQPDPTQPENNPIIPNHYQLKNGRQAIDIIYELGWNENFNLANTFKYMFRAGKKVKEGQTVGQAKKQDLRKAIQYLTLEIDRTND